MLIGVCLTVMDVPVVTTAPGTSQHPEYAGFFSWKKKKSDTVGESQ